MGELARERDLRDLRVSRGHIAAATIGVTLLIGTAFGIGFSLGRGEPEVAAVRQEDGELVELLARLEASGRRSTDELTYPDALEGKLEPVAAVVEAPVVDAGSQQVEGAATATLGGDTPPAAAFTLVVARAPSFEGGRALRDGLRAAGKDAWLWVERVDGDPLIRVAIGGQADEAEAEAARAALEPSLAGAAEVVSLVR
jgi:hypothetical protein